MDGLILDLIYINRLKENTWFSVLPEAFQKFILEHGKQITFEKNSYVFHAKDKFNGIYTVLEGSISLGYVDVNGNEALSAIAEPIMWFGEISLIDHEPRSHDAIALKKSTVLHIPAKPLNELLKDNPYYWYYFARLTSQKLRYVFLEQIAIQTRSLSQRLAQRLLFILEGYGNHLIVQERQIHISQDQLANMLTVSRQTINHELNLLDKQNIIKISFRKIEILDMEKLNLIAKSHT
ncbi:MULTISPECIES: Crp/Fnr family transcriptional regulator [Acinetobacter calcoaceticus/baumannii complex]|uniref:Cyclic nucleotide-binding domain-containing protein n=1 Tax=Acinetobacter nosocomialis TaxID=106654 RepID=A0AB37CU30_ACINO|nr:MULTISPECIES: Crp/Fnr family transcriptional regulator [Acinetobacter calcoaceticus/baumannii complex]ELW83093.1 cyclic nucleotide-binding domain protein [Acinetobacter sp. OIFC021]EXE46892.1 cyclic nucleotide-binding domain protein [Acinetobacter sp. 766875]MDE9414692.1 Crp/Fnr family transcriptional regulator [Acinetobacter nosocomialis]QGA43842.1 cyclic nucleotide-binding domain-containing protein [Acinetobacter nosocomialis]HAI53380.1 Crp/Fnr family transcriptional regulator [Acinetobac